MKNIMIKKAVQSMTVFALFALLHGCYPSDSVSYSDLDIVTTAYDTEFDFPETKTWYLYDSIVHLKDTLNPSNNVDLSREFDDLILDRIADNMDNYGYTRELDPEANPPDLVFTVSVMATKNFLVYNYYPWYYWDWGWGWYYKSSNYWGYYYPPYWGGTYVTSYTVGTLIMNMYDVRNATAETDSIPKVWNGDINGLLGSSASTTQRRLEVNIDQAFEQSSYLKTSN
jgi:hypothetical protein